MRYAPQHLDAFRRLVDECRVGGTITVMDRPLRVVSVGPFSLNFDLRRLATHEDEFKQLLAQWPEGTTPIGSGIGYPALAEALGDQMLALQVMALGAAAGLWQLTIQPDPPAAIADAYSLTAGQQVFVSQPSRASLAG